MKKYSIEFLEELANDIKDERSTLNSKLNILLICINDWSESVYSLEDFKNKIFLYIKNDVVDEQRLKLFIKNIDLNKDSWHAESLFQLLEVFEYYPKNTLLIDILDDIIREIDSI